MYILVKFGKFREISGQTPGSGSRPQIRGLTPGFPEKWVDTPGQTPDFREKWTIFTKK